MNGTLVALPRFFQYGSLELPDPNPKLTLDEVKRVFAAQYPELLNAGVEGPVFKKDRQVFTFNKAFGTKG